MIFLKSAMLGLMGGVSQLLPLNKNIILIFLTMINKSFLGKASFGIDYSSVLFVNLGILAGVLLYSWEELKKSIPQALSLDFSNFTYEYPYELKSDEKVNLLLPVVYVSCFVQTLITSLVNITSQSFLFLIFLELITILLCFVCDYTKEKKVSLKGSATIFSVLVILSVSFGISVIPLTVILARLWGVNKKPLFDFSVNILFVSTLFNTIAFLIKAIIFGFSFVWYSYILCLLFGFVGAFFGTEALKKSIYKKNFSKFGYFHTVFIFIMFYILISA